VLLSDIPSTPSVDSVLLLRTA